MQHQSARRIPRRPSKPHHCATRRQYKSPPAKPSRRTALLDDNSIRGTTDAVHHCSRRPTRPTTSPFNRTLDVIPKLASARLPGTRRQNEPLHTSPTSHLDASPRHGATWRGTSHPPGPPLDVRPSALQFKSLRFSAARQAIFSPASELGVSASRRPSARTAADTARECRSS